MSPIEQLALMVELHNLNGSHSHGDESENAVNERHSEWVNACYEGMPALSSLLSQREKLEALVEKWLIEGNDWEFPAIRGIYKTLAAELRAVLEEVK